MDVALAACDVCRPAAAVTSSSRSVARPAPTCTSRAPAGIPWTSPSGRWARPSRTRDALIVDTSGRLHIDDELMKELADIKNA